MLIFFIKNIESYCYVHTARLARLSHLPLKMALACSLIVVLTGGDALVNFILDQDSMTESATWQFFQQQVTSPLTALSEQSPYRHTSKMYFRLLPPYLGKLCWGCSFKELMLFMISLQYLAGTLFFYFSFKLIETFCKDRMTVVWLTAGFCFILLGKVFFRDANAHFDAFALFFMLLGMYTRSSLLLFLYLCLAFWVDERAIVASALVGVWKLLGKEPSQPSAGFFQNPFASGVRPYLVAIVLAVGFTVLLRWVFAFTYDRPSVTDPAHIISEAMNVLIGYRYIQFIPFFTVSSFESYWIYILGALITLWISGERWGAGLYLLALGSSFGISFLVADVTRSMIYAFPAVFIGVNILAKDLPPKIFQKMTFYIMLAALLFPTYYVTRYMWPFFIGMLKY